MKNYRRNLLEFLILVLTTEGVLIAVSHNVCSASVFFGVIVLLCWAKTAWFVYETSQDLSFATHQNLPYHRFLGIIGINMVQIVVSFALDYYVLLKIDPNSFSGINPAFSEAELLFECFYFSALNFSYFGYGDVTPANIPAKLVTLTGILLGFMTVIFILSDFITLKESIEKTQKKLS